MSAEPAYAFDRRCNIDNDALNAPSCPVPNMTLYAASKSLRIRILKKGQSVIIAGPLNRLLTLAARLIPAAWAARIAAVRAREA